MVRGYGIFTPEQNGRSKVSCSGCPSLIGSRLLGLVRDDIICHNKGGTAESKSFVPISIVSSTVFIGTKDFFIYTAEKRHINKGGRQMKRRKWKGLIGLALASVLALGACGAEAGEKEDTLTIGISQLVEHPALDEARKGFEDGLEELGVKAEIVYQNA